MMMHCERSCILLRKILSNTGPVFVETGIWCRINCASYLVTERRFKLRISSLIRIPERCPRYSRKARITRSSFGSWGKYEEILSPARDSGDRLIGGVFTQNFWGCRSSSTVILLFTLAKSYLSNSMGIFILSYLTFP